MIQIILIFIVGHICYGKERTYKLNIRFSLPYFMSTTATDVNAYISFSANKLNTIIKKSTSLRWSISRRCARRGYLVRDWLWVNGVIRRWQSLCICVDSRVSDWLLWHHVGGVNEPASGFLRSYRQTIVSKQEMWTGEELREKRDIVRCYVRDTVRYVRECRMRPFVSRLENITTFCIAPGKYYYNLL